MTQRAKNPRTQIAFVAMLILLAIALPRAFAQLGGSGMGNIPTNPATMFGKKKDTRETSGPTLSATDEPVADIRVVGNVMYPTSSILNELQTRVGRPFDPALVQRDVRKLASRGWFVDVRPSYEQASNGRIVIFTVVERPVVRYVEYLGNDGIRTKKINKELDLKVGGPVDPYAVQEAKRKLLDLYHRSGYNNAQVSILEGDKPTDHGIVFVINEGMSQKIWKVEFVGNEFLSERRLRTKIDSKPPMLMVFKGYVDREQIDADVNKLTAFYRSFGFFQAKIGRQLEFDEKNKWLTLRFVIHEGPRYQVENVAFIGNKVFSSESLTTGVEMKPDPTDRTVIEKLYHTVRPLPPGPQPFEQARMNGDVEWLKELYGSQGYIFADVQAEPVFLEEQGKLRLLYHINEGKRWRVGNIFVHINGENPHTKITTALNRLSLRSGEIADVREIHNSERRLRASGLFLNDPARGVAPKIVYHIPELEETEMANKGGRGFRGQSPDKNSQQPEGILPGVSFVPAPGLPIVNPPAEGPPLIAPPVVTGGSPVTPTTPQVAVAATTYQVATAPAPPASEEQFDIHLYFDDQPEAAASPQKPSVYQSAPQPAAPAKELSPTAQRYEAHRPPYDEAPASPPANAPAPSTYQRLVVRTQSPYQPPSTQPYPTQPGAAPGYYQPPSNNPYAGLPTNGATSPAPNYGSNAYGGQVVGATGPNSTPPGGNQYPVRPAAITEPQIPPRAEELPQPYAPGPQYGPAPPPGPPPGYGMQPVYTPSNVLPPDPNITPVPLPTNPQLLPSTPRDLFTPAYTDPTADFDVVVSENQTGRIMLGVAVNSDAGLVGQILLDEQNFDWKRYPTSWNDFLDGKAWRGAGQHFRLEAAPGTEVQRYLASFEEPYLWDTPVSLGLSGSYFTRRYRDWDEQRVGGRVSLGYIWTENDLKMMVSYRGEDVKISNPSNPALPELAEVVGSNALHGFMWSIAHDTRDSAFLATEGHFLKLDLEEVIGSFEYPRIMFDGRQYFLLNERPDHSGRHVVTASTRLGFTGNDTPIYENFFAGGFSTLRGFEFRGASPVVSNVQVGGEFMWVNTLEYLFPLTADDMIHGVAFCDFGTVEQDVTLNGSNFRVAPGLGLRITVPAMGPAPIALDFAFPVLKADTDDTQIFSFNIGLQR